MKKKSRALADTLNVLNLYLKPPIERYKQDVGEDFFFLDQKTLLFVLSFSVLVATGQMWKTRKYKLPNWFL